MTYKGLVVTADCVIDVKRQLAEQGVPHLDTEEAIRQTIDCLDLSRLYAESADRPFDPTTDLALVDRLTIKVTSIRQEGGEA